MSKKTTIAGIALRPICAQDQPFLYRVYAGTRADEMALVGWDDAQKESFLRMQFDAQHQYYTAQFQHAQFDIIERADEPIGRFYVDRREDEIRVIDIALLAEHRNGGIGGTLMRELLDEGVECNKRVAIHVERNNPALQLYERLGFAHVRDEGIYKLMEWSPPKRKDENGMATA